MKKVSLEQLPAEVAKLFETVQSGRVLVTRNGEPFAIVSPVGNKDEEDFELEESPEFWKMIQERRRETKTIPLKEVMAQLVAEESDQKAQAASSQPTQAPNQKS